jgi:rRNA pseudouridine-1189 N-methylase Emg1 (Nep1/Mra1 family)
MGEAVPKISSKKLQSLTPAIFIVIDRVNLIPHPGKPRMLCTSDDIDIAYLSQRSALVPEDINIELLYATLYYLQNTALNQAGLQRTFLRTSESPPKLIAIDPRLQIPDTFESFMYMMHLFLKNQLVKGPGGERLMRFVKHDIGESIPPDVPRFCIYVDKDEPIVDVKTFVNKESGLFYVNIRPEQKCEDEVMEKIFCVSNDELSCGTAICRVVRAVEDVHGIW